MDRPDPLQCVVMFRKVARNGLSHLALLNRGGGTFSCMEMNWEKC